MKSWECVYRGAIHGAEPRCLFGALKKRCLFLALNFNDLMPALSVFWLASEAALERKYTLAGLSIWSLFF